MNKKVAVINDLSGFGRCSLTAAISVLSAMGVQACPFPTAILTGQTGYETYYCDDYTSKMHYYTEQWSKMNVGFDGIYSGFVMNEQQIDEIEHFLTAFKKSETCLLVDPVMGDNGVPYGIYTDHLRGRMRELTEQADIITPNFTELCLLTGVECSAAVKTENLASKMERIENIALQLCNKRAKTILVTGVIYEDENQIPYMGNMYVTRQETRMIAQPYLKGSYSGTGDLFASMIIGGVMRGDSVIDTAELASEFLHNAIEDTVREGIPRNDGVNYEQFLGMLMK